jgi:DNA-binding Lrp family transcriptional regulator
MFRRIIVKKYLSITHFLILFIKQVKTYFVEIITAKKIKVASLLQGDIQLKSRPFRQIADSCGVTEKEIINIIKKLNKEGYIRKFGAVLRHHKIGYAKNALVVWSVPRDKIEKAGITFASFPFISHCYERNPVFKSKYNLFTMLHSKGEDMTSLTNKMAASIDIHDFLILESLKEYKKTTPEYF